MTKSGVVSVRTAFLTIDVLFRAAWVIWVPTFFVYLTAVCNRSASDATLVLIVMYAVMFVFEVTLGAVADVLPGAITFYGACVCNGLSYALYALLPMIGWHLGGALVCEVIGGVGMTLFSGAFERWYQSTLELSGDVESVPRMFARLRLFRYATSALFGILGIFLYQRALERGLFTDADAIPLHSRLMTVLLLPHAFGAGLVSVALAVAVLIRKRLSHERMLLAGGRTDFNVRSISQNYRRGAQAVRDGWQIILQLPALRGGIYLACAHQLAVTIVSFYWPLLILGSLGEWSEVDQETWTVWQRLAAFWFAREAARSLAAYVNLRLKDLTLQRASTFALLASTSAGLFLVIGGASGTPVEVKVFLGIFVALLLGMSEPHIDAMVQGRSPPDLRAVMGSYKAMLSSGFCAIGLIPIGIVATWNARGGDSYSFDDAVTVAGALVLSMGVYSWRYFNPAVAPRGAS